MWTWVSQCLLKQRMVEVEVTTGAISCAKLQSNYHHQKTNTQFFYRPDALPVANQQCQSTEGKISHSLDLFTPSSPGVFQLCLWPLITPGYLGWGLPCLSSALWCQYPSLSVIAFHSINIEQHRKTMQNSTRFYFKCESCSLSSVMEPSR